MRTVSVSDLKANLSRYLRDVRRGGEVHILERGVPIARLSALRPSATGPDGQHRERLVRAGVLRPGITDLSRVLQTPPVRLSADLGRAIEDERADRL